jgi:hyaluronan synthase
MRRNHIPVGLFLLIGAVLAWDWQYTHGPAWYGIAVIGLLTAKLALSLGHKPYVTDAAGLVRVVKLNAVAVITCFNEKPELLAACLESILNQTRLPAALVVVDDHSETTECHRLALEYADRFAAAGVEYQAARFEENRGKREGLAHAFGLHSHADVYVCIDSDTHLDPDAIRHVLEPFASRRTNAVTGLVLASNARRNLLTRLIDLRYANAFLYERAAYSLLGSVLCCCGSLAAYRGSVVRENLGDFLGQTFLGVPCTYGDDRRLTQYALIKGRVLLQSNAVAWTEVPTNLRWYSKQQSRWNKSFFRESLWTIGRARAHRPAFWLASIELGSWLVFTTALVTALAVLPFRIGHLHGSWTLLAAYAMYSMLLSYARSARYVEVKHVAMPPLERVGTYLLAPLYGLLNIGLLLWIRLWSLLTLRDNSWGTRRTVEDAGQA